MAHRTNIPEFGNWENHQDDVPYTVFFDKAGKKRSTKKPITPNNPQENPKMLASIDPSLVAPPVPSQPRQPSKPDLPPVISTAAVGLTGGRKPSALDVDFRQFNACSENAARQQTGSDSSHGKRVQRPVPAPAQPARPGIGFDRLPVNQPHHAKVSSRAGPGHAGWAGKSHDSSVGRVRPRPARDDNHDEGIIAVPKFGEWDENNPESAAKFTHQFNRVREEKTSEVESVSGKTTKYSPNIEDTQRFDKPKKCCFPWW